MTRARIIVKGISEVRSTLLSALKLVTGHSGIKPGLLSVGSAIDYQCKCIFDIGWVELQEERERVRGDREGWW